MIETIFKTAYQITLTTVDQIRADMYHVYQLTFSIHIHNYLLFIYKVLVPENSSMGKIASA